MMFGLGVAAGAAMFGGWHWGWSGGGWGNSYTTVNVNRATTISANNFDANRYRDGQWQHDAAHRDSVPYRTSAERERYNQARTGAQQREQFRGQLEGRGATANREGAAANRENRPATQQRPEARGSENRSSAFDGVDRGGQVNRDYDRGRSSWGDRSFDRGGGGGFRGGGRR
jgi:hypothetical protein